MFTSEQGDYMGTEIERKFLVCGEQWRQRAAGSLYCQGYLRRDRTCVVRVRLAGEKGFLTIKGTTKGAARPEFEYAINPADARFMLDNLAEKPLIQKMRYLVHEQGCIWEVDEFLGENKGLVLAEIELEREDQPFVKPDWIGVEVTGDARYYNSNLVSSPFSRWGK